MTINLVSNFLLATPAEIAAELGRRLQAARLGQGLQQADLARMAGVSRGAISSLENRGKSTYRKFATSKAIHVAPGCRSTTIRSPSSRYVSWQLCRRLDRTAGLKIATFSPSGRRTD